MGLPLEPPIDLIYLLLIFRPLKPVMKLLSGTSSLNVHSRGVLGAPWGHVTKNTPWRRLEGALEALGGVLEALGGVLEVS